MRIFREIVEHLGARSIRYEWDGSDAGGGLPEARRAQRAGRATGGQNLTDVYKPRVVGRVPFTDGVVRDVFEDGNGRQWVTGHDGERVYGVWPTPADESVVVERRA